MAEPRLADARPMPAAVTLTALLCLLPANPVPEVEPNQSKPTASTAGLATSQALTGVTRGFDDTADSTAETTRDLWRISLVADPLLIQRHRLQVGTLGTQGHAGAVMGLLASGGVIDTSTLVSLQGTSINTVPARYCSVYTLGDGSPTFFFRLTGSSGTTSPYTVTVTTETVTPSEPAFACKLSAGPVTLSTVGRTTLNTRVLLYHADTLAPIDGAVNNDTPPSAASATGSSQSTLTRTLAPGRYLLAVGNGDTFDHRLPPPDDRAASQGTAFVTDFSGLLVNNSPTATGNFNLTIKDRFATRDVTLSKPGPFGVAFLRFTLDGCTADMGTTGGVACRDGRLDNNDFVVFIDAFFGPNLSAADIGTTGGIPGSDGALNNNDWVVYLDSFFTGCP